MALLDPYAPCPCGSGEKYKWCCQKTEAFIERSERLISKGQLDSALQAIDEGLRKVPNNPWLTLRKAAVLLRQDNANAAVPIIDSVLMKQPANLNAHAFRIQCLVRLGDVVGAIAQLQRAMEVCGDEQRARLGGLARLVALVLAETGQINAAIKHFELAIELSEDDPNGQQQIFSELSSARSDGRFAPTIRHPYALLAAPATLAEADRSRFERGIADADRGRWAGAATEFETLTKSGVAEAQFNLGLCRIWLGEPDAGARHIRAYVARTGESSDNIDFEVLCQILLRPDEDSLVERVRLTWPLRDRDGLVEVLRASGDFDESDEYDDPQAIADQDEQADVFFDVLDRPRPEGDLENCPPDSWPQVLGVVCVGKDAVTLDAFDDGRLDGLSARLTEVAGTKIPPAHPKTKVIQRTAREYVALQSAPWQPLTVPAKRFEQIYREAQTHRLKAAWADTPSFLLDGRTPRQAVETPEGRIRVRAMLFRLEADQDALGIDALSTGLRAVVGIPPEPPIDPDTVEIDKVHLNRLSLIPADKLDDDRLIALYHRARIFGLSRVLANAAAALIERPAVLDRADVGHVAPYVELANLSVGWNDAPAAFRYLERGRAADPNGQGFNAVYWDTATLDVQSVTEPPETWVPYLSVVLQRYMHDARQNAVVIRLLVSMGLVEVVPNRESNGDVYLDPRRLEAVLRAHGARITTASGELGVSAAKPAIWTPDAPAGGSTSASGLWTPGGSTGAPGGEKPKLIIPGR